MNPAAYDASPSTFSSYPFLLEIRGVYPNTRIDQNTFRANITGTNVRGKWNEVECLAVHTYTQHYSDIQGIPAMLI